MQNLCNFPFHTNGISCSTRQAVIEVYIDKCPIRVAALPVARYQLCKLNVHFLTYCQAQRLGKRLRSSCEPLTFLGASIKALFVKGDLQNEHIRNKIISEVNVLCVLVLTGSCLCIAFIGSRQAFQCVPMISRHSSAAILADHKAISPNAPVKHNDPLVGAGSRAYPATAGNLVHIVRSRQRRIERLLYRCIFLCHPCIRYRSCISWCKPPRTHHGAATLLQFVISAERARSPIILCQPKPAALITHGDSFDIKGIFHIGFCR